MHEISEKVGALAGLEFKDISMGCCECVRNKYISNRCTQPIIKKTRTRDRRVVGRTFFRILKI